MTTTGLRELAEGNVRIDRSYTDKIIVADNDHSFEVRYGTEVVIGFITFILSGTLEGKTPDGWNLIIDGEVVDMGKIRPAFFGVLN